MTFLGIYLNERLIGLHVQQLIVLTNCLLSCLCFSRDRWDACRLSCRGAESFWLWKWQVRLRHEVVTACRYFCLKVYLWVEQAQELASWKAGSSSFMIRNSYLVFLIIFYLKEIFHRQQNTLCWKLIEVSCLFSTWLLFAWVPFLCLSPSPKYLSLFFFFLLS